MLSGQAVSESFTQPPAYDPQYPDQNVPGGHPKYAQDGRNIAYVDPLGRVSRTYYDALQRPVLSTQNLKDPGNPNATEDDLVALAAPPAYDAAAPDQNVTSSTYYDAQGRTIGTQDALGNLARTYYDDLGRAYQTTQNLKDPGNLGATAAALLAMNEPPAFDLEHPDWNLTTRTVYDRSGRTIASVSLAAEGCALSESGGVVTASAACSVTRSYYDALGRVYATVTNLQGQAITAEQLPTSRLTEDANLIAHSIYDARGQAIASIDPDPACLVDRGPDGSVTSIGTGCIIHRSYYDDLGRAVSSVRNLVGQDVWADTPPARVAEAPTHQNVRIDTLYDAEGNAIEQVDPNGIVTHFDYDRQGRLTDVYENYRPGLSATTRVNVHTEYIYDASGNRTAIRSANAVLAGPRT